MTPTDEAAYRFIGGMEYLANTAAKKLITPKEFQARAMTAVRELHRRAPTLCEPGTCAVCPALARQDLRKQGFK